MENERKIIGATTGCLGLIIGAALGGALGTLIAHPIAEILSSSRETQAYLPLWVIPAISFLGAVTVSTTGLAVVLKQKSAFIASALGWGLLFLILTGALFFSEVSRPAQFRVENRTEMIFENVFVGADFRESKQLGRIEPNQTSKAITVDLDDPTSYNRIEGRAGAGYVRYRQSSEPLTDGNYRYVVTGSADDLTYTLKKDE